MSDQTTPKTTTLTVDRNGFLRVGQTKAPFKYDPKTGAITFVPKDKRVGGSPVQVRLTDLANVK